MFFFGSGRYKEQLKLLYKVHKDICRNASPPRGIRGASSAAMQVPLGGLGGPGGFGLGGQGGFLCRKALWRLLSRLLSLYREKNFVPLCLCVKL